MPLATRPDHRPTIPTRLATFASATQRREPSASAIPRDGHRATSEAGRFKFPAQPITFHSMRDGVFVHEQGLCESESVGAGTRVWAFAHVMPGARVGRDCNICDGAFIEDGAVVGDRVTIKNQVLLWNRVEIGDDCFIGPGAVFTNDRNPRSGVREGRDHWLPTKVGQGATIGANSTIVCGIEIGARAFIGAGSVVSGDLPAHAFAVGNPARQVGWACYCGNRLGDGLVCADCGRRYRLEPEDQLVELVDAAKPR